MDENSEYMVEVSGEEGEVSGEAYSVEELLIECVRARPVLWDSRLPLKDRSKTARDNLWLEVYNEFGAQEEYSLEFLTKKWRNLRDTYVRLKGTYESYVPSGSGAKKRKTNKTWQYYDAMSFLDTTIARPQTISNLKSCTQTCSPLPSPDAASSDLSFDIDAATCSSRASKRQRQSSERQSSEQQSSKIDNAIVEVLARINPPPTPETCGKKIENPICNRIAEYLEKMPVVERAEVELQILQIVIDKARPYL